MLYMSIERKMQQIYNPTFRYVHENSYKNASNTSFSRTEFYYPRRGSLHGMIDRLIEDGRHYGMEKNVEKTRIKRISPKPSAVQITVDQKQPNNVEYFNYLVSMITNDARCTREIKSRIFTAKVAFNKTFLFTSKLDSNLRKRLVKWYIWNIA